MKEPDSSLGPSPETLWRDMLPRILGVVDKHLGPGDLAELRRLRPEDPGSPAYWKLLSGHLAEAIPAGGPAQLQVERRWATILRTFAELKGLHAPGIPLGRALAEAGFSELRFSRLLRARESLLDDAVRGASRILASKGQRANLSDFASLVLLQDGDRAEEARRRLARHFYAPSHTTEPS